MIRVTVQTIENYADDPSTQNYWKNKWGQDILVLGTDERPANAMAIVIDYLDKNHNSDRLKHYPIDWSRDDNFPVKDSGVMAILQTPIPSNHPLIG